MKITVVCDVLGETNNGTVLAAKNLIGYLQARGHMVKVVAPGKEGGENFYVVPAVNLGPLINWILAENGVQPAKADKTVLRDAIQDSDVVHLLVPLPLSWAAAEIAHEFGIPITASFHCQAENVTAHVGLIGMKRANQLIYRTFEEKVYKYCTLIHYPTEFIRRDYENAVGHSTPGRVISNGVNDVFFEAAAQRGEKEPGAPFTVISVGRYSNEKAQGVLIRAIGESKYKDNIRLVLAGKGPMEKKLRLIAAAHRVNCTFSFFSREDLIQALLSSDLYVHTAVAELEAISCLEAIVTGLVPIICDSKRSATREFAVDQRCLFHSGDPADLRNRIEYFYGHPAEIKAYREIYSRRNNAYRQGECMNQMERMLEDAVRLGHV